MVFEVDVALHKKIIESAIPQRPIPGIPWDPSAPNIVDSDKRYRLARQEIRRNPGDRMNAF